VDNPVKIKIMKTPPVCDYEGSDYQDQFWKEGGRAYEDAAEALALKKLLPPSGRHLLELGAGAGRNTPRYKGFKQVTLLDYSTTQLEQAKAKLGEKPCYRYVAADVYQLPFAPGIFDAATMIRTLHHLSEPQLALDQVGKCLENNAIFILEFANKRNLKAILRYWLGKQKWDPFSREAVEFVKLNFDFHPASVREMLAHSGFLVERQICVSHLRSALVKKALPLGAMNALEAFMQSAFYWAALTPSIFLRTRVKKEKQTATEDAFFRCPACGHYPLPDTPPRLTCTKCGQVYRVKDGIYDFRLR
jgi:ubiquinone/menaquinone biosynthesis C-methylase UbiE/uncharacterized protein YbaR (Trm112 family)